MVVSLERGRQVQAVSGPRTDARASAWWAALLRQERAVWERGLPARSSSGRDAGAPRKGAHDWQGRYATDISTVPLAQPGTRALPVSPTWRALLRAAIGQPRLRALLALWTARGAIPWGPGRTPGSEAQALATMSRAGHVRERSWPCRGPAMGAASTGGPEVH